VSEGGTKHWGDPGRGEHRKKGHPAKSQARRHVTEGEGMKLLYSVAAAEVREEIHIGLKNGTRCTLAGGYISRRTTQLKIDGMMRGTAGIGVR